MLNKKILFLERMLYGFQSMDQYLSESLSLMACISEFQKRLYDAFESLAKTGWTESILCLKIKALFELIILNDIEFFFDLKDQLREIEKQDALLNESTTFTKTYILDGKSIVLMISLLEESFSNIVNNKNKNFTAFFGYPTTQISKITQLMPLFLSEIHSNFVEKFIKKGPQSAFGQSFRPVFGMHKDGYIFPLSLYIGFSLKGNEDFYLSGVMTKVKDSSISKLSFN